MGMPRRTYATGCGGGSKPRGIHEEEEGYRLGRTMAFRLPSRLAHRHRERAAAVRQHPRGRGGLLACPKDSVRGSVPSGPGTCVRCVSERTECSRRKKVRVKAFLVFFAG